MIDLVGGNIPEGKNFHITRRTGFSNRKFSIPLSWIIPREDKGEPCKKKKKKKKKLGEKFARHGRKSGIMVVIGTAECTGIRVSRVDSFFLRIVSKPESFACLPAKKKKKRGRRKKTPFRDCRGKEGRKGGGYCLEGYVLFIRLFSSSIDVRIFIHA